MLFKKWPQIRNRSVYFFGMRKEITKNFNKILIIFNFMDINISLSFFFVFSCILRNLIIISCVYWPFVFCFLRNAFSEIFPHILFIFGLLIHWSLYILYMNSLLAICITDTFCQLVAYVLIFFCFLSMKKNA